MTARTPPSVLRSREEAVSATRSRVTLVVAGLALLVALGMMVAATVLQARLDEQRADLASLRARASGYQEIVAVLQTPDIEIRPIQGTELAPVAFGRLYVDPETGNGMIVVRSLPPLGEGRAYQLWWTDRGGNHQAGGLLTRVDERGDGYALIRAPLSVESRAAFSLTEEPAAGSSTPTSQPLLLGTIE